jgi:hypothetical protein
MATTGTNQGENQRRRLPKLTVPNPVGASSDETPRTVTSDHSARQRRRARQQSAREKTPNGREIVSPPSVKDVISYPIDFLVQIFSTFSASFTTSIESN